MRTPRGLQELGTSALGVHGAPWRKRPGLGLRPGHNPCPSQHPGQTLPVGSTWQMLPIPDTHMVHPGGTAPEAWGFSPPCYEPRYPDEPLPFLSQARCSGQWITNITIYDQLRVPADLPPGEYVLGLRWDCETSAQVWSACADVTITAPKEATHA